MDKERPYKDRYFEDSQSLMLEDCNIGDEGFAKLFECDWEFLRKIDLSFNKLTNKSAEIYSKQKWDELISLHWGRNQITDEGVILMMKVNHPKLKSLWLNHNKELSTQAVKAITDNGIPNLETIWLSFNKIQPESLAYFVKGNWDKLTHLHLAGNHFGPQGVAMLASKKWRMLEHLQLYDCNVEDKGVEELVKNEWPTLTELHLSNNKIGDEGIEYLIKNSWTKLIILHLSTNVITDKGALTLLQHPWHCLNKLKMKRVAPLSEETKQKLRIKFCKETLIHIDQ